MVGNGSARGDINWCRPSPVLVLVLVLDGDGAARSADYGYEHENEDEHEEEAISTLRARQSGARLLPGPMTRHPPGRLRPAA